MKEATENTSDELALNAALTRHCMGAFRELRTRWMVFLHLKTRRGFCFGFGFGFVFCVVPFVCWLVCAVVFVRGFSWRQLVFPTPLVDESSDLALA